MTIDQILRDLAPIELVLDRLNVKTWNNLSYTDMEDMTDAFTHSNHLSKAHQGLWQVINDLKSAKLYEEG